MVRQVISFILASALFVGGTGFALMFLFTPGRTILWFPYGAGFCGFVGAAWLWADFIAPLFGRKGEN
jgi:hypothetical protein